jgi:hypothetical protein
MAAAKMAGANPVAISVMASRGQRSAEKLALSQLNQHRNLQPVAGHPSANEWRMAAAGLLKAAYRKRMAVWRNRGPSVQCGCDSWPISQPLVSPYIGYLSPLTSNVCLIASV